MNRHATTQQIERLALLFAIERSEAIIDKYKDQANKRNLNQAVIELLRLKTKYNLRYGLN